MLHQNVQVRVPAAGNTEQVALAGQAVVRQHQQDIIALFAELEDHFGQGLRTCPLGDGEHVRRLAPRDEHHHCLSPFRA